VASTIDSIQIDTSAFSSNFYCYSDIKLSILEEVRETNRLLKEILKCLKKE